MMQPMRSTNDARIKILEHISEFFMEFTMTDEIAQPELEELLREADEQAGMLMDSMGIEITAVTGDVIHLNMKLNEVGAFIDNYLDQRFTEDADG